MSCIKLNLIGLILLVTSCSVISGNEDVAELILHVNQAEPSKQVQKIQSSIDNAPLLGAQLIKILDAQNNIPNYIIYQGAQTKRLEYWFLHHLNTLSPITINTLMNSASISVNHLMYPEIIGLRYKVANAPSLDWLDGLNLEWNPATSAMSGSIIGLTENTEYIVQLLSNNPELNGVEKNFTTRTTPPIDPEKIYYLSDIYEQGVLDLPTLGIQGSETGWAKVIGDVNHPIIANEADLAAINIGDNSYIVFENITISAGGISGISSYKAHHLWFSGCDISNWGRSIGAYKNGIGYQNEESEKAINYDSAFRLKKTGVVTIENCDVHSPRAKSNSWAFGHPLGPNAMLVDASHPNFEYQGQYTIRNNRFYGTDQHRFNDVIESASNGSSYGGFIRDSAIYNNYFAYANDDVIELDGSQHNILVYNNIIEQGYCGISAIPNRSGPSYIFNNVIKNLGDERGKSWGAIKLGGLMSRPGSVTNIYHNLIITNSNGLASAGYMGDATYWVNAKNNIIVLADPVLWTTHSIYDRVGYAGSHFSRNVVVNLPDSKVTIDGYIEEGVIENLLEFDWLDSNQVRLKMLEVQPTDNSIQFNTDWFWYGLFIQ